MKNHFLIRWKNTLKIKIEGRNVDRFLRKLINHNIELLDIKYGKKDELFVTIYEKDYDTIEAMKTIYEIHIVSFYGINRLKKMISYYKLLLTTLIIGCILLLILTNVITKVEVIHTDSDIRALLLAEMKEYGIEKFHFKKSYNRVEEIKKEVLKKHKNEIEWLEIENIGTKYVVRVEERKINDTKKQTGKVNIVAKKPAVIKRIDADKGVVTREINNYVNPGDVIISGEVYLNEELKNITSASGKVYGEVWYKSTVEFPYLYKETHYTGNEKEVYSIKFLNHSFDLFNFHPYKQSKKTEKVIIKHPFLPFRFVKERQKEAIIKDDIYTVEAAITEARKLAAKKIEQKLGVNERIITSKDLNVSVKESKIRLEVFFTVYEDITDYQVIDEEKLKQQQEEKKGEQEG